MYHNVLVPIALDHEGGHAASLQIADALSAAGAKLTLLHVVEEAPGFIAAQLPEGMLEKNFEDAHAELMDIARAAGPAVEADVIRGHSARSILDYAKAHGCDCIVIASHKPGIEDYFLGSTAAHVVRHAPCSVHVIR